MCVCVCVYVMKGQRGVYAIKVGVEHIGHLVDGSGFHVDEGFIFKRKKQVLTQRPVQASNDPTGYREKEKRVRKTNILSNLFLGEICISYEWNVWELT